MPERTPRPTQPPAPGRFGRGVEAIGFASVWNALYGAAALYCLCDVAGTPWSWPALLYLALLSMSVYTFDRVKIADRYEEPQDRIAHPRRHAFVRRRRTHLRTLMWASGAAAVAAGLWTHPLLSLGPPIGWALVLLYARPRDRGRRPKDVLVLKNLFVALAFTTACAATAEATAWRAGLPDVLGRRGFGVAFAFLACQIFADAVVCDIDDRRGDARYGTRTIPVVKGEAWGRAVAMAVNTAASLALIVLAAHGIVRAAPAYAWGLMTPISTAALVWGVRGRTRDAGDLRLVVVALLIAALPQ